MNHELNGNNELEPEALPDVPDKLPLPELSPGLVQPDSPEADDAAVILPTSEVYEGETVIPEDDTSSGNDLAGKIKPASPILPAQTVEVTYGESSSGEDEATQETSVLAVPEPKTEATGAEPMMLPEWTEGLGEAEPDKTSKTVQAITPVDNRVAVEKDDSQVLSDEAPNIEGPSLVNTVQASRFEVPYASEENAVIATEADSDVVDAPEFESTRAEQMEGDNARLDANPVVDSSEGFGSEGAEAAEQPETEETPKHLTVTDMYQDRDIRVRAQNFPEFWDEGHQLDEVLAPFEDLETPEQVMEYVRSFDSNRRDSFEEATLALDCLPPDMVLQNLGEDALVWAAANSMSRERSAGLSRHLAEQFDYDQDGFGKAVLLNARGEQPVDNESVMKDYHLIAETLSGSLADIELPPLLEAAALPGVTLSTRRLGEYALTPIQTEKSDVYTSGYVDGWHGRVLHDARYKIFLDAPVGFMLTHKGRPQAVASFRAGEGDEILIGQLQGVRANKLDPRALQRGEEKLTGNLTSARGLAPLNWRKLLVDITTEHARSLGMSGIAIRSGGGSSYLDGAEAYEAYDMPAQRLHFKRGDDGNWHRPADFEYPAPKR